MDTSEAIEDGVIEMSPETMDILVKHNIVLSRLVEDLRQLSIVDAGQMELDIKSMRLDRPFKMVDLSFQHQRAEKRISLKMDISPNLPEVKGDQARIVQVLGNLMSNAILYTPEGGCIELNAGEADEEVVISVIDTGPGIAKEELDYVFERFYRTDKSRTRHSGGTGLGLSIARALVEAHQGRMWVESEAGKGTSIFFTLPTNPTN